MLETRIGPQQVRVAATATIRGDHGAVLSIRDLAPGDAVTYQTAWDSATSSVIAETHRHGVGFTPSPKYLDPIAKLLPLRA